MTDLNSDIVIACADLVGRCGSRDFTIGYMHDDVPAEEAGWYAQATFKGARISVDEHRSQSAAALALAERLLRGATCRCGDLVSLADGKPGCRWQLLGKRWEPGCDVPPVRVSGSRGDFAAMRRAFEQPANHAAKRAGDG